MKTLLFYFFSFLTIVTLNAQTSLSIAENFEKGGDAGDFIKDFIVDTDGSI